MNRCDRVRVLDIPVDVVNMQSAIDRIDSMIRAGKKGNYILAVNPEKINVLHRDEFLRNMFEKAALLIPDGIGVVMAVRLLFRKSIARVPGADLMQNICKHSVDKGYRIFLYGAHEEVSKSAVDKLNTFYPGIKIVGRCNGYLADERMNDLVDQINSSGADILFVALGSPKQERWIQQYLPKLNIKVCQGIGGTLDTIDGRVKRAPVFFQKLGLEWFYRLLKEPRRLRRQLVLPVFAFKVIGAKLRMYS